jgi:hypothetical protein
VFESTSVVTGSIPTEYIKCESVSYSIKHVGYVNLDNHFRVSTIGGAKNIIKPKDKLVAVGNTIPDTTVTCRLNKVIMCRCEDLIRFITLELCSHRDWQNRDTGGVT